MADVETKETKVVSSPVKKVPEEAEVCEKPKAAEKKVVEIEDEDSNSKTSNNMQADEATSNDSSEEKDSEGNNVDSEKSTNGTAAESSDVCSLKRKSTGETGSNGVSSVTSPKKAKLVTEEQVDKDVTTGNDKPAEAPAANTNGV